ncbi:hypothetical protein PG994_003560 [Apiospora phragmitis]|uniref:Uncharacterized protein n=1 Tax=Apiospora phragmitis TaxID=2905665 RepID=A0ABR1VYJ0_9PEZI
MPQIITILGPDFPLQLPFHESQCVVSDTELAGEMVEPVAEGLEPLLAGAVGVVQGVLQLHIGVADPLVAEKGEIVHDDRQEVSGLFEQGPRIGQALPGRPIVDGHGVQVSRGGGGDIGYDGERVVFRVFWAWRISR